uniref:cellulase n=1 Tax=Kalanchoe fedtschenkoi TaxID=63787 RepID=A0A7N0UEW4_KALFE
MFDVGDHMKFGFPLAFTATVMLWSILEYGDQMQVASQLDVAQGSLKWIMDYLIAAHPSDNVLYIQVRDPELDHGCWERPETMNGSRPFTQINATFPGSEMPAETAAALASASPVFKSSNPDYAGTLLKHAKTLFTFADKHRKSYSVSILEVQNFYNSTGFADELLWAACWLYHATGDDTYFSYTERHGKAFTNFGSPTWFSWDNKLAAV